MALIKCPECGKEISEKAFECPQCGKQLKEKESSKKYCSECKNELNDEDIVCPKCGCPVETKETGNEDDSKHNSKKIIIVIIFAIVIIGSIFGVKKYQDIMAEKAEKAAEEAAEKERLQISEDYAANLELVSFTMITGAAEAEEAGGLIHDVWYNTIYEESDTDTDKYTKGTYGFNDDFNTSLQNLFSDVNFQSTISSIETNQETVKGLMKKLINPPEEYNQAYNALKDYYDSYIELTNLVINPTGSLQTFTNNFNNADSAVAKYYEAMKIYIE